MKSILVPAGTAAILACVLAWELLPAADDPADAAGVRPDPIHAESAADADPDTDLLTDVAETVLARPLFSPDRRLPETGGGPAGAGEDMPRLTGIVIGPTGGRAIFEDASGRPKIAAPGDSLGRFKVGTIAPGQVSLTAADGTHMLRPKFVQSAVVPGAPSGKPAR